MVKEVKSFGKETLSRIKSESPEYFKPIQKIGLGTAGLGIILKAACMLFPATMPIGLAAIAVDLIGYGLMAAGISKLPNKDK